MPTTAEELPPLPDLESLNETDLSAAKTRVEVRSLWTELQELRAWRSKLIFSSVVAILAPLGSVVLFLVGWYGSHAADRRHQEDDLYTRSAKQLSSSSDAAVRLSGVLSLEHFVKPADKTLFTRFSEGLFASKTAKEETEGRTRAVMALLIGTLSRENDPAVLDAIAEAAAANPDASLTPLVALNKSATVLFARAAGEYSGLSALRMKHKTSFPIDYWKNLTYIRNKDQSMTIKDPTITDLVTLLLRSGSPFEVAPQINQRFSSRDFFVTPKCSFREIFQLQQTLAMGEGFNVALRAKVPTAKEINTAMSHTMETALTLERSSYILGKLATDKGQAIDAWTRQPNNTLYGTAIVVGDLNKDVVKNLRDKGSYFTSSAITESNPGCQIPK